MQRNEEQIQLHVHRVAFIFKNFALLTDFITEIDNTQVDNVKGLDILMPVPNSFEYIDDHTQTTGNLHQFAKIFHFITYNNLQKTIHFVTVILFT